jgi:pyruvate kinase
MARIEKGKTKIIGTIGPATESEEILRSLIIKGLDVARLNTKHNEPDWHLKMVKKIRKISQELDQRIGILLDLQGPEIRAQNYQNENVHLKEGEDYYLVYRIPQKVNEIQIDHPNVLEALQENQEISMSDGQVTFKVVEKNKDQVKIIPENNFLLGNRKTVNIPGLVADIPSLTKRDQEYLKIIENEEVDFVGLSFVRTAEDIITLKDLLQKVNSKAQIVAKIETKLALDNIHEIIKESDVLMIARGDLGIENPIEEIAYWQKKIVRLCRQAHKPVIVATQMLLSMTTSSTPSRAEATDIANAVFDGTDAIMLSEETATGNYPEKAVAAMAKISHFNEKRTELSDTFSPRANSVTELFAKAAADFMEMGEHIDLDKILIFTDSGYSARVISSYRPQYEIIAITDKKSTANQLTMVYGVSSFLTDLPKGEVHLEDVPFKKLMDNKLLNKGDNVLVLHGSKLNTSGISNILALVKV